MNRCTTQSFKQRTESPKFGLKLSSAALVFALFKYAVNVCSVRRLLELQKAMEMPSLLKLPSPYTPAGNAANE